MNENLMRLKVSLTDWQNRKAGAEARLEEMRSVLLGATLRGIDDRPLIDAIKGNVLDAAVELNIAETQVFGIQCAINYAEGVENGTINLSDGRDTDDWLEQLR